VNYRIVHRTTYGYSEPVTVSHHAARIKPRMLDHQRRLEYNLQITPEPPARKVRADYFGNSVCFFSIQELHNRFEITAESLVSVAETTPPAVVLSPPWEQVVRLFSETVSPTVADPYQFCFDSPGAHATRDLADYALPSFAPGTPLLQAVTDLNRRIHADFTYDPAATTVTTPLEKVISQRRGVCQDFAHLAIASLRSMGLPARYVSGYLRTRSLEGQSRLVGADASHAWFSAFCPDLGWVDFDPTNNVLPLDEHITVAYGRDFDDVSPVRGILTGGGEHIVKVSVDVTPV